MSQRASGYKRKPQDAYPTPPWCIQVLAPELKKLALHVWDPARGSGRMVRALQSEGFKAGGSSHDFFKIKALPERVTAIVTNPPYGPRGTTAVKFIEHALELPDIDTVCMLLTIDFDSAKTRQHVFGDCRRFAMKLVLLDRISWWETDVTPSQNHAWFIWSKNKFRWPVIKYAERPKCT